MNYVINFRNVYEFPKILKIQMYRMIYLSFWHFKTFPSLYGFLSKTFPVIYQQFSNDFKLFSFFFFDSSILSGPDECFY